MTCPAELIAARATGHDYTGTGKPDIAWDDADAKDAVVTALVTDALALLGAADPDALDSKAATRTRCWRWSPARTWNRPTARTGRTGGGGSPGRSARTA